MDGLCSVDGVSEELREMFGEGESLRLTGEGVVGVVWLRWWGRRVVCGNVVGRWTLREMSRCGESR